MTLSYDQASEIVNAATPPDDPDADLSAAELVSRALDPNRYEPRVIVHKEAD